MSDRWVPSTALETDLYHLDAAYIAWESGLTAPATFDLFTRSAPFGGAFLLVAGTSPALDLVARFRYTATDLAFLGTLDRYDAAFLDMLAGLRFTGSIDGFAEGTIAFPNEPLLRVTAPFIEALLLESALLRSIGIATLIATKAARMSLAAEGRSLADFALRRAHDPFVAARSAYIGGFASTSYVDAARRFGIPASGTIPHALVQAFDDERSAFAAVAAATPEFTLLLDTYDVERGTLHAIEIAHRARETHRHRLVAVRLDSGPLEAGSRHIRAALDAAGLADVRVLVSGDIDEYRIQRLVRAGAPVDGFGVGGNLGVGLGTAESGHVGGVIGAVYKLAWYDDPAGDGPRMKIAGGKSTMPGRKAVWRIGALDHDIIGLDDEALPGELLLLPQMRRGRRLHDDESLATIRERAQDSLASLPAALRELAAAVPYPVAVSERLTRLLTETRDEIARDNA